MDVISHLTRSAASMPAQSTTLSQQCSGSFAAELAAASGFIADEKNYIIDRIVIQLLISSGLRISEVLSISGQDVASDGSILIHGKKGSDVRYVSAMQFSQWLGANPVYFANQIRYRNRFFYYRLFKRLGISRIMSGNKNNSVTHLFRYAFVERIKNMSGNLEETAQIIGHKNPANTKRYSSKTTKNG